MKKQLFGGYSVRETEVMLGVLKDENKVLQKQIAEIKRMLQANNAAADRKKTRLPIKRVEDEAPAVLAPTAEAIAEVENVKVKEEAVAVAEAAEVLPEKAEETAVEEVVTAEVAEVAEVSEAPAEEAVQETEPVAEAEEPKEEVPVEAEQIAEVLEVTEVAEAEAPKAKKVVRIKKVKAVKAVAPAAEIIPKVQPIAEEAAQEPVAEEAAEAVPAALEVIEAAAETEVAEIAEAEPETVIEPIAEEIAEEVAEEAAEIVPEPVIAPAAPEIHSNMFDISMRKCDAVIDEAKSAPIEAVLPEDIDGVVCIEKSVINDIGSIKDEITDLRKRLVRMQEYLDAVQKHKAQVNNKRILAAFQQSGMSVEEVLGYLEKKNRFDVSGR